MALRWGGTRQSKRTCPRTSVIRRQLGVTKDSVSDGECLWYGFAILEKRKKIRANCSGACHEAPMDSFLHPTGFVREDPRGDFGHSFIRSFLHESFINRLAWSWQVP